MRKFQGLLILAIVCFGFLALAQVAAPVASGPVAVISAPPVQPVGFIGFVKANLVVLASAVYFLLDIVILVSPGLAGNGILHQIMITAGKLGGQTPTAS
jgi:hypothetical protein